MQKNYSRKNAGFTLIELMIVLIILGLLASLVAPDMFRNLGSSKIKTASAQMNMFETALDTYRLDVGKYPKTLNELVMSDHRSWDGPYIKKAIPLDPWGNPYQFKVPGENGAAFIITSYGADGQTGGEGEDADVTYQ